MVGLLVTAKTPRLDRTRERLQKWVNSKESAAKRAGLCVSGKDVQAYSGEVDGAMRLLPGISWSCSNLGHLPGNRISGFGKA